MKTTKLFSFLVLFIASVMFLTMPVSAITYENLVEDPVGLGYYSPTTMLEIESTRGWITVFNPSGAGSLDVKIYDLPNPEDAQIGSDGYIYFILEDGRVFKNTDSNYKSFVDDYNTSFILLGDVDTSTTDRTIVIDFEGNIYVGTGNNVYKFTANYYSGSVLYDFNHPVEMLAMHKDGLLIGSSYQIGGDTLVFNVSLYDLNTGSLQPIINDTRYKDYFAYETDFAGLYSTSTGDIYFSKYRTDSYAGGSTESVLQVADMSDSWSLSTIYSSDDTEYLGGGGIVIDSNGVIYIASIVDDVINTYSTLELSGGYSGGIVGDVDGSYINWDAASYTLGDTGSYIWGWDADDKSLIRSEKVKIYKDDVLLEVNKIGDTGTRYFDLNEVGTYCVLLVTTFPFTADQVYASDYTEVNEVADSWINIPQTAPQRTNFTVNYMYGSTPSSGLILMKRLDETTGIYETVEFDLLGDDKIAGTTYSRNVALHSTGTYKITLIHDEQVDEIYDVIEITSLYVPPIETVGNSSISSDKSTYAIGETIFAQYAVDYTNYTTYNVNMEVYNIDKDIISYSVPTIDQISYISQTIPITNEYFTGSHSLRLTSYDNTGTQVAVLANKSITVGLVNDGGFGLSLSKYDVMQLELFVIKAIAPTSANIRVWSVERDTQAGSLITINGSTYLNYAIPLAGKYEITLSSGGFEITKQYITVHEGFVDGEIEDEIEDDEVTFDTKFESMLSSGAFVALLIIIACVGAFGKIGGVVGVFLGMVVGISISFLMGHLPPWVLFIMVLALCVVFVSKLINSFGGGE